ncbi:MAG: hypothetical protein R3B57_06010 [Phycisphaerales bacterium]
MSRTTQNRRTFSHALPWALAIGLPLVLGGCAGGSNKTTTPSPEMQREGRAVLSNERQETTPAAGAKGQEPQPVGLATRGDTPTWTIVLARPIGSEPDAADRLLQNIRTYGGVPEARLETRRGKALVVYGRYASPDDPSATRDLERFRERQVEGKQIFAGAFLAPPPDESLHGSNPEWDLRNVKQRFGDDALYTLQVGVYARLDGRAPTSEDLSQFRAAAERAVAQLRADGEQAFYHHGPSASTVTVGVFGESDFDPDGGGFESPQLADARKRHPNNLVNGQGFYETLRTDTGQAVRRLQRSQLVSIPDR